MKMYKFLFLMLFICFLQVSCVSTKVATTENDDTSISEDSDAIVYSEELLTGMPPNINGTVFGDIDKDDDLDVIAGIEITLDNEKFIVSFADGTYLLPNVTNGEHILYVHDPNSKFKDESIEVIYDYDKERFMKINIILEKK